MTLSPIQVETCRKQFPALSRQQNGQEVVYFDGPAGTQVPQRVIDSISHYLSHYSANHEGCFATSRESDAMLDEAHRALADFVGSDDPGCIAFGQNMTSLTFALSRSLARTWQPGDEVLLTRLDHDANVTPWVMAAADAGAIVKYVEINKQDCTLDLDDLRRKFSDRTRLVAVGCASNSVGTVNPVRDICNWAHDCGALVFLDAVHYAPHAQVDVQDFGCDFLACSTYKFFGPHLGVMWGRRELLEQLTAYKVRPASDSLPGKWMNGTQSHEAIAGALSAVDYLADLGRTVAGDVSLTRRAALTSAYAIGRYERELFTQMMEGLSNIDAVKIWGIADPQRFDERLPTVSITHDKHTATEMAQRLGDVGIFTWNGNYYALQLTETLGLEPEGMLRIGLVHYNTHAEVERLLACLRELS